MVAGCDPMAVLLVSVKPSRGHPQGVAILTRREEKKGGAQGSHKLKFMLNRKLKRVLLKDHE